MPLGVSALDQLIAGQAGGFQEAGNRLFRRVGARPLTLLRRCLRLQRQAARDQRQPTRRREALYLAGDDAGFGQFLGKQPGKIGRGPRLHPRGNFFRAQFEKEIRAHAVHPFFSIQAAQLPFARSRTRPI